MYRPSKYDISQESLMRFKSIFDCDYIKCAANEYETYDNDGYFFTYENQVGFDWEIRDRYFANGIFKFDTLGQYERKIKKPSIDLSIQCDSTETAVIVAWHEDFLKEPIRYLKLTTDTDPENGKVRYTKHFRVYPYTEIESLRQMLATAMDTKTLNHLAWS